MILTTTPTDNAVRIELEKCSMQLAFRCNRRFRPAMFVICTGRTSVFAMISQIGAGLPASSDPDSWVRMSRPNVARWCHPGRSSYLPGLVRNEGLRDERIELGAVSARGREATTCGQVWRPTAGEGFGPRCPVGESMTRDRQKCIHSPPLTPSPRNVSVTSGVLT